MQDMGIEIVEKKIIIGMDKVAYVNVLTKLFPPWRSQNIVELWWNSLTVVCTTM